MAIELVNIDDRLIHGQIATSWVARKGIESIIIVNDKASKDPVQARIAGIAVPGKKVSLFSVDKFIEIMAKNTEIKRVTMLIFTTPIDVLKVVQSGVNIPVVNISGMRFGDNRVRLHKNVSVTEEERAAIETLLEMGVEVAAQTTLNDDRTDLKSLLNK